MEVQRLELIAREVRQGFIDRTIDFSVIERMYSESPFLKYFAKDIRITANMFPSNNCIAATLYLKHILKQGEVANGWFREKIDGEYLENSHNFLLLGNRTVVDITADQFQIDEQTRGPPIYIGPLQDPWRLPEIEFQLL